MYPIWAPWGVPQVLQLPNSGSTSSYFFKWCSTVPHNRKEEQFSPKGSLQNRKAITLEFTSLWFSSHKNLRMPLSCSAMEMFRNARAISAGMAMGEILKRSKTSYKSGTTDEPEYKQLFLMSSVAWVKSCYSEN